ncbi:MAG TPA: DNA-directed RNA polymerase subunit K [Candidatus Pacearchaeota archaeon]|nr:DNA-directed RNA polymerase subunit K [Candidatus Pacearchaeota archaeon]
MKKEEFTKYEVARIIGARALQIAMNAPLLIKMNKEDLEKIKYDSLKIAEIEFESEVLPISVKKPFPQKKEEKLKRIKEQKISDEKIEEKESKEEEEIAKEGEIMEIVNPADEQEEVSGEEENEGE